MQFQHSGSGGGKILSSNAVLVTKKSSGKPGLITKVAGQERKEGGGKKGGIKEKEKKGGRKERMKKGGKGEGRKEELYQDTYLIRIMKLWCIFSVNTKKVQS